MSKTFDCDTCKNNRYGWFCEEHPRPVIARKKPSKNQTWFGCQDLCYPKTVRATWKVHGWAGEDHYVCNYHAEWFQEITTCKVTPWVHPKLKIKKAPRMSVRKRKSRKRLIEVV